MLQLNQKVRIKNRSLINKGYLNHFNINPQNLYDEIYIISSIYETADDNGLMLVKYALERTNGLQPIITCYWDESDLAPAVEECITSIKINNRHYSVGKSMRCTCKYTVTRLNCAWDSITGKHIEESNDNDFAYQKIKNLDCQVHCPRGK